ncbi:unnamed protein product [Rotaria socialis]|uniref:Hexosyltransferase n=1 Tax=Rotaria socialis TaxID=392032 RepID=A0A820DJH8_9BILA|nr:unnamed protein product [Rotaria socialis]CAF3356021.1 unnamed protein product [Rotaria socialis]CAF3533767.1 unnamed protein product [Rotaria socialis]CAF4138433.1 unnamed protein product [Rotaria socialis]CAF4233143.1 unnamed protein product [Rotaria socialis]
MVYNSNHNNNCVSNCSRKYILIILLLLNALIGVIYYIHGQKEDDIDANVIATNTLLHRRQHSPYGIKTIKPIESIKKILEKEYNRDDLMNFYNHVQKEYSLGLKCTRIKSTPATLIKLNVTKQIKNNTRIISTKFSSLVSSTTRSYSRRFQRTNLHTFIIDNSNACLNEYVDLVIIIMSKSNNFKTRDAIRRTWASGKDLGIYSSINIKYFFLIDFDEKLSHNMRLENNIFHDIIQVELPEQYTLVTQRVLSLIEWSFRYCRTAKYLFKTDDDIFVNLILLLKFISSLIKTPTNNSFLISDMKIYGYQHIKATAFRQASDPVGIRYIVTVDEYPCKLYPTFLSGFGYLISKKARDAILYAAYQDVEPFRISDVYFTGIIPDYLSIPRQPLSNYSIRFFGNCDNFFNHPTAFACAGSSHHGNTSDTFNKFNQYWQLVKQKHRIFS